jgi:hypothetical protein
MGRSQDWILIDAVKPTERQLATLRSAIRECAFEYSATLLTALAEIDLEENDDESGATIIVRAAQQMAQHEAENL